MAPRNGYVPDNVLVEVQTGVRLERATAAAWLRAKADAARAGVTITVARPAGGYRSYQDQYNMKNGIPSYAAWGLNPNNKTGLAIPGQSNHGLGICVDVIGNSWMLANGPRYGFSRPFGNADPNHWLYNAPTWSTAAAAGGATTPINNSQDDYAMYHIFKQPNSPSQYVQSLITGKYVGIGNETHLGYLIRAKTAPASQEMYTIEADIVAGYLAQINPPAGVDVAALTRALDAANDADTSAILAAVGKITVASGNDPQAVADAVKKVLAGEFDAIPQEVLDAESKRLQS